MSPFQKINQTRDLFFKINYNVGLANKGKEQGRGEIKQVRIRVKAKRYCK